jgi:hypothetical protein
MKIYRPIESEANVQNAIRIALSDHGIVFRSNAGKSWQGKLIYDTQRKQQILIDLRPVSLLAPGFSDLLFVGQDQVAFIECKRQDGTVSVEQARFLEAMRRLGHIAGVARSVDDAMELIKLK